MYTTKITSQGTISIPAAIRQKYGLKPGHQVYLEDTGELTINLRKTLDLNSLRKKNASYHSTTPPYQNGAGMENYVADSYGQD